MANTKIVKAQVSDEEYAAVKREAERRNMSISELIREKLHTRSVIEIPTADLSELLKTQSELTSLVSSINLTLQLGDVTGEWFREKIQLAKAQLDEVIKAMAEWIAEPDTFDIERIKQCRYDLDFTLADMSVQSKREYMPLITGLQDAIRENTGYLKKIYEAEYGDRTETYNKARSRNYDRMSTNGYKRRRKRHAGSEDKSIPFGERDGQCG